VSVFKPGLDTTGLCESLEIGSDENLVFSVGRLSRRKGCDQVIRALAWLREAGSNVH
jgi:phosphatidylinositol alpha-1,6-mannosyltransferase